MEQEKDITATRAMNGWTKGAQVKAERKAGQVCKRKGCGKPENYSCHTKHGPDLENPMKHRFEPAEPSAAGEPPRLTPELKKIQDEFTNAVRSALRGNQPQEGVMPTEPVQDKSGLSATVPTSKAPGVGAEPSALQQDIEDALDTLESVDGVLKLQTEIADLRRQLAEETHNAEVMDNAINGKGGYVELLIAEKNRAEAAEKKLAAALPSEEAIALAIEHSVKSEPQECCMRNTKEGELCFRCAARAVLAMLRGENNGTK